VLHALAEENLKYFSDYSVEQRVVARSNWCVVHFPFLLQAAMRGREKCRPWTV